MHTIAWKQICKDKELGVLRIRNLLVMNQAMLAKLVQALKQLVLDEDLQRGSTRISIHRRTEQNGRKYGNSNDCLGSIILFGWPVGIESPQQNYYMNDIVCKAHGVSNAEKWKSQLCIHLEIVILQGKYT